MDYYNKTAFGLQLPILVVQYMFAIICLSVCHSIVLSIYRSIIFMSSSFYGQLLVTQSVLH